MARQKGIIKLDGTIGDITFYKSKDGYLAREKGGIPAEFVQGWKEGLPALQPLDRTKILFSGTGAPA
jgi:hypothetical protein